MHLFNMKSINWRTNLKLKKTLISDGIIVVIGILYFIWYRLTQLGIPCVVLKMTGFYCPGCGTTRMVMALARLDFVKAFQSNPFVLFLLPYGLFLYIRHYVYLIKTGSTYQFKKHHNYIFIGLTVCAVLFGIVRNLPSFYFLRP